MTLRGAAARRRRVAVLAAALRRAASLGRPGKGKRRSFRVREQGPEQAAGPKLQRLAGGLRTRLNNIE